MSASSTAIVQNLSFGEKLQLVEDLWDDLSRAPEKIPLSDTVKAELDRRYADYLADPKEGSSWEDVKRRVLGSR